MRFAPTGLQINFYDTGATDIVQSIEFALSESPEVIIGPVFAGDARMLRDNKPGRIPALSFTSDATAVGNGVFSVALLPSNTIEAILQEMSTDDVAPFIIIAPDSGSGQIMAGTAKSAAAALGIENIGVIYYTERNTDSIKNAAINASLYTTRSEASTQAKEILSAIVNNEYLTREEKESVTKQLDNINRTDTLGNLPYKSILFLGGGDDTKSLVSFLRYYGVDAKDTKFYGTSMWQDTSLVSDIAMNGAKFATMPDSTEDFTYIHESATGAKPSRMAALGYDTMLVAIGGLYSPTGINTYLSNQSGYNGTSGLFRFRPDGLNERALQIVKLTGGGQTVVLRPAQTSFMKPLYSGKTSLNQIATPKAIEQKKINIMDYIDIPERLIKKYSRKNYNEPTESDGLIPIMILENNPQDFTITAEDYKPIPLETVSRTYIDSVEVAE